MSWRAQGCVWAALAAQTEKPGVPELSEPSGIEDFIEKEAGRSFAGETVDRVAGSKAENGPHV